MFNKEYHKYFQVTHLYIPASVATALAKSPLTDQYNLSRLQHVYSGAAMLSKEVLNASRSNLRISQTEQGKTYGPVAHIEDQATLYIHPDITLQVGARDKNFPNDKYEKIHHR